MNCDVCKSSEATVFLTQIVQGQMQKANLCEQCASNKGVTDPTGFALADLLAGITSEQRQEASKAAQEKNCPNCGFTQSDFKKTGRLGCSHCFAVFGPGLESLLKAMHKGTRHVGKVPARAARSQAALGQLSDLQEQLDTAVQEERYEDAATLRDRIQKLAKEQAEAAPVNPPVGGKGAGDAPPGDGQSTDEGEQPTEENS